MNTALIFAGGSGKRMNNSSIPKQFLKLYGKEIILYTVEQFEKHEEIDAIVVVCLESWIDYLKKILKEHGIKKVKWIVPGGATGQESIYNGLCALEQNCEVDETIVLIHDGVRPMINEELIHKNIVSVRENGSAVTVSPAVETIIRTEADGGVAHIMDRGQCTLARAPQSFCLKDILAAHRKALEEGHTDFIDSVTMMQYYGKKLYTVEGPAENIKVTTPLDYYVLRAMIQAKENEQEL